MYPEQHSPLSWSRRPARPWQPYSLGFFPGLQLPYRQLSNVTPDRPLRPGSLTNSSWMRNCTVLGDAAWWPLRATLIFFPSNIPQPGFLSPSCRSILFWGPWATKLEGACKSFYTRGIGPVQLAVCCWTSLLTSLCFTCHISKVGIRIEFT